MDKEIVVHLHNRVLHSGKKIIKLEICGQMKGSRKHQWGKSDPQRQISYVLTHKWLLDIKQKESSLSTVHNPREPRKQRGP